MSRRRNNDHVRTLTKVAGGKSYSITLPISIVREMEWEVNTLVCVKKWGSKIIIQNYEERQQKDQGC
jgi:hypothetical protein